MLLDRGSLAFTYSFIACEKSNLPSCSEGGLFKRAFARTVASSMAKHAPVPSNISNPKLSYEAGVSTLSTSRQHKPRRISNQNHILPRDFLSLPSTVPKRRPHDPLTVPKQTAKVSCSRMPHLFMLLKECPRVFQRVTPEAHRRAIQAVLSSI